MGGEPWEGGGDQAEVAADAADDLLDGQGLQVVGPSGVVEALVEVVEQAFGGLAIGGVANSAGDAAGDLAAEHGGAVVGGTGAGPAGLDALLEREDAAQGAGELVQRAGRVLVWGTAWAIAAVVSSMAWPVAAASAREAGVLPASGSQAAAAWASFCSMCIMHETTRIAPRVRVVASASTASASKGAVASMGGKIAAGHGAVSREERLDAGVAADGVARSRGEQRVATLDGRVAALLAMTAWGSASYFVSWPRISPPLFSAVCTLA